jgi:hypothetical protein
MRAAGRTKHDDIGARFIDTRFPIREYAFTGHFTRGDDILHLCSVMVTDTHQLRMALAMHPTEQLIHMTEIKINPGDAPFFSRGHKKE